MRFHEGIDAQPAALESSAAALATTLPRLRPPPRDAVVALVGIGASEYVARGAAPVWRSWGLRAFPVSAAELADGGHGGADVYVGMSESGRSAETVAALESVAARKVCVTNDGDSPLAAVADEVVLLQSGPDSPVYTTGYTATLQAVGMLGEQWAGRGSDWSAVPRLVADVLRSAEPVVKDVVDASDHARLVDVVGSGASNATAGEGALLLREAARLHTAAHETRNYLHGPMETLDPQAACIIVGDGREVELAHDVAALGCHTLLITTRPDVAGTGALAVVRLPRPPSALAGAVLQILPVQLLGRDLADRRGLAVRGFRYRQGDTKLD
ncbi:SIS domain-containing protein [Georgenia sp. SYP-B2076]|uniref:SIS domain-containing protein n=1 Tax=Georgenia sp. SYP-B2076 TaxID=2495881 RepID=UPI0013E0513A|nr:SIS domain-containing protein [Georgenia sp. SYP-B2076]